MPHSATAQARRTAAQRHSDALVGLKAPGTFQLAPTITGYAKARCRFLDSLEKGMVMVPAIEEHANTTARCPAIPRGRSISRACCARSQRRRFSMAGRVPGRGLSM